MRPQTVHCVAQLVRHSRGCITTLEKWVATTPPDVFAAECAEVIFLIRGGLTDLERIVQHLDTTLAQPRSSTAPAPAPTPADRPAVLAARSSAPRTAR